MTWVWSVSKFRLSHETAAHACPHVSGLVQIVRIWVCQLQALTETGLAAKHPLHIDLPI